jgi:23S rRNA U2552 (ribose-2'-O)-methylase RlmE/FtsJ
MIIGRDKINFQNSVNNTDKFRGHYNLIGHNYWSLYKNFVKNDIVILEIGTAYGGFAKFIKDNFTCKIIGAELQPIDCGQRHVSDLTNNNSKYDEMFIGNAFSSEFLKWNSDKNYKYDLIIEDADHSYETQIWGLNHCEQLLQSNGVYVIEDVQTYEDAKKLMINMPQHLKKYSYIWDGILSVNRYDDLCVVVDLR